MWSVFGAVTGFAEQAQSALSSWTGPIARAKPARQSKVLLKQISEYPRGKSASAPSAAVPMVQANFDRKARWAPAAHCSHETQVEKRQAHRLGFPRPGDPSVVKPVRLGESITVAFIELLKFIPRAMQSLR
jgi:hypothetical protein